MSTNLIPVESIDDQFVNLLVVYNALNVSDRQVAKLTYARDKTLLDYMEGLPDPEMWSVCVNAEPYHMDDWAKVYPAANDYITVIPVPYGGGDDKGILRMVAMIAVAMVAPYAAGMMLGVSAAAVGTTAAGMALTAGITMVGGMLVNALLPPPKPSANNRTDASESPTYGIDGAKNTQGEDVIVPLIYGEFRYNGNFVNVKTQNSGRTQLIYAQAVVSEGEVESISDFMIDNQPIGNFDDVYTVTRRGTDNQSIVGWFASAVSMQNKGITLAKDWTEHNTVGEVDGFRIDLVFPMGLSNIDDDDGDRYNRSVNIEIQYRRVGTSSWLNLFSRQYRPLDTSKLPAGSDAMRVEYSQSFKGTNPRTINGRLYIRKVGTSSWTLADTVRHSLPMSSGRGFLSGTFHCQIDSGSEHEYRVEWDNASPTMLASARYSLSPTVTAKTNKPLRRSFESPLLTEGEYQIRVRRTNDEADSDYAYDKVTLSDVAEIITERVRYNHTAFYGVRIRLSDQLNGLPQMSAKVKGIKVPHYDRKGALVKRAWSANPAWIVVDMLTNTRYGAGLPKSRIDLPMFVEWAEFCDANKYYFNGAIDTFSNIWDACQLVLRVGHARFTSIGNVLSLSIYRAAEPVMMFGTGNILEGTLSLNWQSLEDRSNEFEVEYFDRNDNNKQNTVRVVSEDSINRGEMQRISTTRMIGIDNQKQALHEAHFQKALNEALVMSGKFETTIEALACGVGDVVLLQHDMPDWGESGRVRPGSTTTQVIVDRDLVVGNAPTSSSMLIMHSALKRDDATVRVINLPNNTLYLTASSINVKARRLKMGAIDRHIIHIAPSGSYVEVTLDDASGFAVDNKVELWDTDVIESRAINDYDAETNTITLAGPLSAAPTDFANYMIGTTNAEAKPVSIVSIDGDGDYKRTISFVEYNETIFTPEDVEETPLYTEEVQPVQHVVDLRVTEELTRRAGSISTDVFVMWNPPIDGNYAGAWVYLARNGGSLELVQSLVAGATTINVSGTLGDDLTFKVVAYDGAGRFADFDSAPTWMHTVLGEAAPPKQVEEFVVEKGLGGIEFSWKSSKEIDVVGYEIREGVYWETGVPVIENFSGNRFYTTKKTGGVYTYHIKAIDTLGNKSEQSAQTILSLPTPSVVMGFSSVQNGDSAILEWRKNPEVDIAGYEIRSGATWANSQHVVYVSGTSWSIPVGSTAINSYLIKAYDTAGVESAVASKVNQAVYRSQSYNAVYSLSAHDLGYPGSMLGLKVVDGRLEGEVASETAYAEYVQPIEMERRFNAMVTTDELVAAKATESRSWSDMSFPWMSPKAAVPWFPTKEADDISMSREISLYVGQQTEDVVAWELGDATGTASYGTGSIVIDNVSSTPNGRYGHGILVNPASVVEATFSGGNMATWWMRPTMTPVYDLCRVVGSLKTVDFMIDGADLVLIDGMTEYRSTSEVIFRDGWNYFMAVSVSAGKVALYIRCLEDGRDGIIDFEVDIGSLSGLRLV